MKTLLRICIVVWFIGVIAAAEFVDSAPWRHGPHPASARWILPPQFLVIRGQLWHVRYAETEAYGWRFDGGHTEIDTHELFMDAQRYEPENGWQDFGALLEHEAWHAYVGIPFSHETGHDCIKLLSRASTEIERDNPDLQRYIMETRPTH